MLVRLRAWWQKIKQHPYVTVIVALCVLILFILFAYRFGWDWTGFNSGTSQIIITSTSKVNYTATVSQPSKSLWDWLNLLGVLAVPAVVGLGAAWYTAQQGKVSNRENKDNQYETALQAYIDKMSELLLKEHLGERTADGQLKPEYRQVRDVAEVRTITVLRQLNSRRVGYVFAFLLQAGLMSPTSNIKEEEVRVSEADLRLLDLGQGDIPNAVRVTDDNAVSLFGADLHAVNWSQADLFRANLSHVNLIDADLSYTNLSYVNLSSATLSEANLSKADLSYANLHFAHLPYANLSKAKFSHANLSRAYLGDTNLTEANLMWANLMCANLSDTNLSGAYLHEADLSQADLSRADLSSAIFHKTNLRGANLNGATNVTVEELEKSAQSLEGATMPDGSKHP